MDVEPRKGTRMTGRTGGRRPGPVVAMGIGALVGFTVGAALYVAITPLLEAAGGWVEELQGLSWNLVPALGVVGAVLGAWWGRDDHP